MNYAPESDAFLEWKTRFGNIYYYWSQKINPDFVGLSTGIAKMHEEIEKPEYNSKTRPKKLLSIVSEHMLHPLAVCWVSEKCKLTNGNFNEWIRHHITEGFELGVLPQIVENVKTRTNLHVIFLAAAYRIDDERRNRIGVELIDEYNKQIRSLILKEAYRHKISDRLQWMETTKSIVFAPIENLPLVLDKVHLSARNDKTGLQSTHRAIVDVVLNVYCEGKMKREVGGNENCCF